MLPARHARRRKIFHSNRTHKQLLMCREKRSRGSRAAGITWDYRLDILTRRRQDGTRRVASGGKWECTVAVFFSPLHA